MLFGFVNPSMLLPPPNVSNSNSNLWINKLLLLGREKKRAKLDNHQTRDSKFNSLNMRSQSRWFRGQSGYRGREWKSERKIKRKGRWISHCLWRPATKSGWVFRAIELGFSATALAFCFIWSSCWVWLMGLLKRKKINWAFNYNPTWEGETLSWKSYCLPLNYRYTLKN